MWIGAVDDRSFSRRIMDRLVAGRSDKSKNKNGSIRLNKKTCLFEKMFGNTKGEGVR